MEAEIEDGSGPEIPGSGCDVGYGGCAPDSGVRPAERVRNLGVRRRRKPIADADRARLNPARGLREALIPKRTLTETASILSKEFGRPISKQLVELWELSALMKVLDGFRAERGLYAEPNAELDRLNAQLETLERVARKAAR
jgi:hypothetical protein